MKLFKIIVPVYQNAPNLPHTVESLVGFCKSIMDLKASILFIDDGSKDSSFEEIVKAQEKYPDFIEYLKLTRNFGQTPAIQAGLRYANADVVGIISCDLQDPYQKFEEMLNYWRKGHKFILGVRLSRPEGFFHKLLSKSYWSLVRHFSLEDFPSEGYDFCLLDKELVVAINNINEKNTSIFPLIFWLGFNPLQINIVRSERVIGKSKWSIYKKVRLTVDTLLGFTRLPIRFITYSALSFSFLSLTYILWILFQRIKYSAPVPGWASIASLISFFSSIILFALGIMAEYLSRILDESRGRPPYVIDEVKIQSSSLRDYGKN